MPEITLGRFWNPGDDHFAPGDVIEVDEAVAEWLTRTGAVVAPVVVETVVEVPVDQVPPVDIEDGEDDETELVASAGSDGGAPAKAAPVEEWRKYAEAKGIATKGLSKQDLIAATR